MSVISEPRVGPLLICIQKTGYIILVFSLVGVEVLSYW